MKNWEEINKFLIERLGELTFESPVYKVYNPLVYAGATYAEYLSKYGKPAKKAVFLGMNPGPWGMIQTGVPFGEVNFVKDFLKIQTAPDRPVDLHPKRPVNGFDCKRSEVSGRRLWGWISDRFVTPEKFFEEFFVANYCPLSFMEESGRNRTPDKLKVSERKKIYEICDIALFETIKLLQPEWVIGIGKFAEKRAKSALSGLDINIISILHPSPASPAANKNWSGKIENQLKEQGVLKE